MINGYFSVSSTIDAKVAEEAEFSDANHKEYKVTFDIFDRGIGTTRRYSVFISRNHLMKTVNFDEDYHEDSKKAAIAFARVIIKKRFHYGAPAENAAVCHGKICEFKTIAE